MGRNLITFTKLENMVANELRIGNIVEKGGVEYVADFITIQMAHNYNPIPLTPEILEKCGFKRTDYTSHKSNPHLPASILATDYFDYRLSDFIIEFHKKGVRIYIEVNNDLLIKEHVQSLHQIQNLYYALTNEELQVNL